jgi:iron(III) transport system substrate-binding protein
MSQAADRTQGPGSRRARAALRAGLPVVVVAGIVLAWRFLWLGGGRPLVVYCAHDSVYSNEVLRAFERKSGVSVAPKYDTEATKSLGLVELLVAEKEGPVCDVFWNNQLLGTLQLQEEGMLLPYRGPGYERIPDGLKDPEGRWAGFAARFRVWIVNTGRMEPTDEAVRARLEGDLSRVAIANPLFGTTLTHYSVLWDLWGAERLKAWHRSSRERGLVQATGNAHVKNLVARGVCDLGLTDTDDFFAAKDEGLPVAMVPVRLAAQHGAARLDHGPVVCMPNTVAIIRGTRRLAEATRLVDYLLSEECELALANSRSRQIPLGPVDESRLPREVRELKGLAAAAFPLARAAGARAECVSWLKNLSQ